MKAKLFSKKYMPVQPASDLGSDAFFSNHRARIERELQQLGIDAYDKRLPEAHLLPQTIHPNEIIQGIVFGKYTYYSVDQPTTGRGVLVVTNQRILMIDKKPLFTKTAEISYQAVSAVTFSKVGPAATVILHTRLGNFKIRTFNQKCARSFVAAIEGNLLTANREGGIYESTSDI